MEQRHPRLALIALLLLTASSGAVAQERRTSPESIARVPDPDGIEITFEPKTYETGWSETGFSLEAEAHCSETSLGQIEVRLGWETQLHVESLRVDITSLADGFTTGRFFTPGIQAGQSRQLELSEVQPGVYYYWRLLVSGTNGWAVRGNGRFDTPICPVDWVEEQE